MRGGDGGAAEYAPLLSLHTKLTGHFRTLVQSYSVAGDQFVVMAEAIQLISDDLKAVNAFWAARSTTTEPDPPGPLPQCTCGATRPGAASRYFHRHMDYCPLAHV